ncbi:MAG: hypothetical protein KDE50_22390, partial [Caldilineaceae bacterium]|nr:hypothetical protein [Caldilineaceae bacterium]
MTNAPIRRLIWLTSVTLLFIAAISLTPSRALATNPIVEENQQPGSSGWQIFTIADDVNMQIKGYASATSVDQGGNITFYITVTPAQTFSIDIYRMGWYNGAGGRLMQHIGPLSGTQQPAVTLT